MKKLLVLFVAIFLATSAYALVETNQAGPQNITVCYAVGTGPMTSGNVVVLETSSPTYYGAQVTGTTEGGLPIYGVVVDGNNYTSEEMAAGKWMRVQTYGYNEAIKFMGAVTVNDAGMVLCTSPELWRATSTIEMEAGVETKPVSGCTAITLESKVVNLSFGSKSNSGAGFTIKGFLRW